MNILVIGACNIDIIGTSNQKIILNESNVGEIKISLGGVAKNIATNLYNLGANVSFLTLIGSDYFSNLQKQELNEIGLDFSKSFFKNTLSSTYLAVHGQQGDLNVAINDMRAFEDIQKTEFDSLDGYIKSFDVLAFDTNLNESSLSYLIEKYKNKIIYVDGVSQTKVSRIRNVLEHIDLLKINKFELNALLNIDKCDIIVGVKELNKLGLKNCLVSSAKDPITYNIDRSIYQSITHKTKDIKSTMGAGDALFSGTIFYLLNGKNMHEAVNFGKIVASKTLEVFEACNRDIKLLIDL
ncbi:PfkB family carbohydrate kinase [Mycoplasmatota bacterium WC30]